MNVLSFPVTAKSRVSDLARNNVFDLLDGAGQLVVYLRLIAAVEKQGSRRVKITNTDLHRNRGGRTAASALSSLEQMGLIKIRRGAGPLDRTIEVR
jgi:hypothetical protein